MKWQLLILTLLTSQIAIAFEPSPAKVAGNWVEVSDASANGTPFSTFELHLDSNGEILEGRYCYVTRYGAKIDCDPQGNNLKGVIDTKTGVATVEFNSSFGAKGGQASLNASGDLLQWTVTRQPKGGEYYGPNSATLRRSSPKSRVASPMDLDGDGKPDMVRQSSLRVLGDGSIVRGLGVKLSSRKGVLRALLQSDTGSLEMYPATSVLIVDRSERSSRDAAEFGYSVFRWDANKGAFCLLTDVSGTPANQLAREWLPTGVSVTRYAPCTELGSDEARARVLPPKLARSVSLDELTALGKDKEMPEYLAFDLASQVDANSVTRINDAGFYQEQAGFLHSALILLSAVHDHFPNRAVAQLNLADTYWKLGDKSRACVLYAAYLAATTTGKRAPPDRVVERACAARPKR